MAGSESIIVGLIQKLVNTFVGSYMVTEKVEEVKVD